VVVFVKKRKENAGENVAEESRESGGLRPVIQNQFEVDLSIEDVLRVVGLLTIEEEKMNKYVT
jgi:hypothetical protein